MSLTPELGKRGRFAKVSKNKSLPAYEFIYSKIAIDFTAKGFGVKGYDLLSGRD